MRKMRSDLSTPRFRHISVHMAGLFILAMQTRNLGGSHSPPPRPEDRLTYTTPIWDDSVKPDDSDEPDGQVLAYSSPLRGDSDGCWNIILSFSSALSSILSTPR